MQVASSDRPRMLKPSSMKIHQLAQSQTLLSWNTDMNYHKLIYV
jgi:hypothetical protein